MSTKNLSTLPPGRPKGAKTFNQTVARAFGQALRQLRVERGISQDNLALRCNIERSYLGKIERGEHMASFDAFLKIAEGLQVDASDFVTQVEAHLSELKKDHAAS